MATITLNRPAVLNAWTDRMGFEVRHAVAQAEHDPRVVGIVITGAGRGFCSGADMTGSRRSALATTVLTRSPRNWRQILATRRSARTCTPGRTPT